MNNIRIDVFPPQRDDFYPAGCLYDGSIRDDLICQVLHGLSGCVSITRLMMKHSRALLTAAEAPPRSLFNTDSASCDDP